MLSIYQKILKKVSQLPQLVFKIDNNQKCIFSSKSAY